MKNIVQSTSPNPNVLGLCESISVRLKKESNKHDWKIRIIQLFGLCVVDCIWTKNVICLDHIAILLGYLLGPIIQLLTVPSSLTIDTRIAWMQTITSSDQHMLCTKNKTSTLTVAGYTCSKTYNSIEYVK